MHRLYAQGIRVTSGVVMLVGILMVVVTLVRGGGPLASGVVLGTMFALLGAGRLYLSVERG